MSNTKETRLYLDVNLGISKIVWCLFLLFLKIVYRRNDRLCIIFISMRKIQLNTLVMLSLLPTAIKGPVAGNAVNARVFIMRVSTSNNKTFELFQFKQSPKGSPSLSLYI